MSPIESFDHAHTIALGGTGSGASMRVLKMGDVIGGAYRLKSLLGKGGMGYVFCAEQTMLRRDYALKMLAPEQLNDESRRRFEVEARAIANLEHRSIIKVYDMGLDEGNCPFYVMDLLNGRALSECIDRRQTIALEECMSIFRQIASGLGYAHSKGIVHRDVKPSNIMLLTDSSGKTHVKIVDFGIAKLLPSASLSSQSRTATGAIFGSPYYMSPEQCLGTAIDHRSDIYSLGCTLFETLCGKPQFCGESALETVLLHQSGVIPSILKTAAGKDLPQSVDLLLTKMLAKSPEDRYQSMDQLKHDLTRIKHGKPIGGASSSPDSGSSSSASSAVMSGVITRRHKPIDRAVSAGDENEFDEVPARARSAGPPGMILVCGLLAVIIGAALGVYFAGAPGRQATQNQQHLLSSSSVSSGDSAPASMEQKKARDELESTASKIAGTPLNLEELKAAPDLVTPKARKILTECGKIKSTIVTVGGIKQKQFVFPEWPVGYVSCRGFGPVAALKTILVPADRPLLLEIGPGQTVHVLDNPEVVGKIDPGEFCSLRLGAKNMCGFRGMISGQPEASDPLKEILKSASTWSNLESLALTAFPISDKELAQLNDFKHLRSLEISYGVVSPIVFAKQPFLNRLSSLEIQGITKLQPVCVTLARSQNLEKLTLGRSQPSLDDILMLRSCPKLHSLIFVETDADEILPAVTKLPSLQTFGWGGGPLTVAQIKMIMACPNIKHLILNKALLSPDVVRYCSYYQPNVSYAE